MSKADDPISERDERTRQDAPAMTRDKVMLLFQRFAQNAAQLHLQQAKRIAALEERIKAVEARGGAGVSVVADSVAIPGMDNVATMMRELDATLKMKVKPIYDSNGMLAGARRVRDDE